MSSKTMNKSIIYAGVAVLLVGFGLGYLAFGGDNVLSTVSTSNDTKFSSAKIAETGFAPADGSATSTSILNTDSTDRVVTGAFYYCNDLGTSKTAYTGTGLANLIFSIATTSTANTAIVSNSNYLLRSNVATTSAGASVYVSSTTTPFPDDSGRLWASGSYITVFSNATNTADCVAGVTYLAS